MNQKILLVNRPVGSPKESDFRLATSPVPALAEGECLVRSIYLSLDPYLRGRMDDRKSYTPPIELGNVMEGFAVGRIVKSNHPDFKAGEIVLGNIGWQEYGAIPYKELSKINPDLGSISTALGILGMPGLTAYFGLFHVGQPQSGKTIVISGATGTVGSTVGQLAKIKGCQVIGITSSDEKIKYLTENLGFDGAVNHKAINDLSSTLQNLCPEGIDIYFDNVGGSITDTVIPLLNVKARVAVCGQSSQYNLENKEMGPRWLRQLIIKRVKVEGFLVWDFIEHHADALEQLSSWLKEGKLRYDEHLTEGIENTPRAFIELLAGDHQGKQLVRLTQH
jgi:NADPH-dependent curcumin reductase CurA